MTKQPHKENKMKPSTLPDKAKTQECLRLFREALSCYQKSLEIKPDQLAVLAKIEEVNERIKVSEYIINKHEALELYEKFCNLDKYDIPNNENVLKLEEKLKEIISNVPHDIEAIVMLQKVFISSNRFDEVAKLKVPSYGKEG